MRKRGVSGYPPILWITMFIKLLEVDQSPTQWELYTFLMIFVRIVKSVYFHVVISSQ